VESIIRYTSKLYMLISGTGASRVPRFKSSTVSAFESFKSMAFLYRYDYSYLLKSMADTVISQWQNLETPKGQTHMGKAAPPTTELESW
jgi:hypothetical protein